MVAVADAADTEVVDDSTSLFPVDKLIAANVQKILPASQMGLTSKPDCEARTGVGRN